MTVVARALIIGGGVCGPVTAMALQRVGIGSVVFEAYGQTDRDVGSYLTVATNGIDALNAIGVAEPVAATGFPTRAIVLFSGSGKRLGALSIGRTRPDGMESHTFRRSSLRGALVQEATRRGIPFEYRKRVVTAEPTPRGVVARFEDGSTATADMLIGCDGMHSVIRRIIDPDAPEPRYVGLLNFGGCTPDVVVAEPAMWHMIFGRQAFFGYTTDPRRGTVWFANIPRRLSTREERDTTSAEQWKLWLADQFANDKGVAADLISAGNLELAADNTHDLPWVKNWYKGPMMIIGDAAHAPAPTSGQGASMAMEDGVVLAHCLRDAGDVSSAFMKFERLRRARVERIVAQGARLSRNKAVGPVGRALRDLMLPFVFRHVVTEQSLTWMYDHHIAPLTMTTTIADQP